MKALGVAIPESRGGRRKIPRAAKRFWASLSSSKKGKLSKSWKRIADPAVAAAHAEQLRKVSEWQEQRLKDLEANP